MTSFPGSLILFVLFLYSPVHGRPLTIRVLWDPPEHGTFRATGGNEASELAEDSTSSSASFWIGIGFGYGIANTVCQVCGESGTQEGSTAAVKLGYGFSRDLLVGLEADLWINGDGVWDRRTGFDARKIYRNRFMAAAFWQPSRESGFTIKLGAGLSFYSAYNRYLYQNQNSTSLVTGTGVAATIGAGYDLAVSRTLILTPSISYNIGTTGDFMLNEYAVVAKEKTFHLLDFSVSIVFRTTD